MKRLIIVLALVAGMMATPLIPASSVYAQDVPDGGGAPPQAEDERDCKGTGSRSLLAFPTWYQYLTFGEKIKDGVVVDPCAIVGPVDNTTCDSDGGNCNLSMPKAVSYVAIAVVEIMLRLASILAVGFVMYGGFKFITSQGDPEGAKNARQTIQNALIGLVLTLLSAAIVSFIMNQFNV